VPADPWAPESVPLESDNLPILNSAGRLQRRRLPGALNHVPHCAKPIFDFTHDWQLPFSEGSQVSINRGYSRCPKALAPTLDYTWLQTKIEVVRYGEGVPPLTAVLPCQTGMADDS
jgi:hypothetical protein